MRDTSAEVAEIVRARYARMSGATRVMIGADMFETARALVLASFPPGLTKREIRRRLCRRFYGALAGRAFIERGTEP